MEVSSKKTKLDFLKRLEYLQKQELKTRFAIKFSEEENNEIALNKFKNDMEEIQKEIDYIIESLSKDTEIRRKYMEQWKKLTFEELKASFGIKIANDEKNSNATKHYERNLIKTKVKKKKIEEKLNDNTMFTNNEVDEEETIHMSGVTKKKNNSLKKDLQFNRFDIDSDEEIENATYLGDIKCYVQSICKTDNDNELAKEYDDYEMDEDKRVAKEYGDSEI